MSPVPGGPAAGRWRSCVCQVLQNVELLDRASVEHIPPEPPVADSYSAGTARSAQGRADRRGGASLAREHRSGISPQCDGRVRRDDYILLVSSERSFVPLCDQLHPLLLMLFQIFHVQVARRFDPVLVHLDCERAD
jgi:hypothetical protein